MLYYWAEIEVGIGKDIQFRFDIVAELYLLIGFRLMKQLLKELVRPFSKSELLRDIVHVLQRILQHGKLLIKVVLKRRFHLIAENRIDRIEGYEAETYERNQAADQKDSDDPVLNVTCLSRSIIKFLRMRPPPADFIDVNHTNSYS